MAELIAHTPQHAILETSGYIGEPTGTIEITENGEYNVKQYANADVNVPNPPLMDKSINENGVYKATDDDVYGYSQVTVNVPQPSGETTLTENNNTYNVAQYESAKVQIPEEEKTVTPTTSQQIVTPTNGLLRKVTVEGVTSLIDPDIQPENIKQGVDILGVQGTLKPPTLTTKQITENGIYSAEDDNADGYSEVTVAVPQEIRKLVDGTITEYIDDEVTSIRPNAFCSDAINITQLETIKGKNVIAIGHHAFAYCNLLSEIDLPAVTIIPRACFQFCGMFSDAVYRFPAVKELKEEAFGRLQGTHLRKYFFPELETIGEDAFRNGNHCIVLKKYASLTRYESTSFAAPYHTYYVPSSLFNDFINGTNWSAAYTAYPDCIKTIEENFDYLLGLGYTREELL